jgi:hypothetical protein
MKFSAFVTALLLGAASIFALPVAEHGLIARGYDDHSKVIVAKVYVVTQTEIMYEAKCDYDKYKMRCDAKVCRHE